VVINSSWILSSSIVHAEIFHESLFIPLHLSSIAYFLNFNNWEWLIFIHDYGYGNLSSWFVFDIHGV
jgi:hypothetical protein